MPWNAVIAAAHERTCLYSPHPGRRLVAESVLYLLKVTFVMSHTSSKKKKIPALGHPNGNFGGVGGEFGMLLKKVKM